MKIGVPKEIKTHEYRVGLTPAGVRELAMHGHQVMVEHNAAAGIGIADDAYRAAGATVVDTAAEVFADRRHDREGEGAAAGGDRAAAARAGAVHLSASRRRQGADRGADAHRRHLHRL